MPVSRSEKERILRFLKEKKKRNAKVVSIRELTEFIEVGGRFKKTTKIKLKNKLL